MGFNDKRKSKEQKRRELKILRLKDLIGVDFCACGSMYKCPCDGECRAAHSDNDGTVRCFECYRVDVSELSHKRGGRKRLRITTNKSLSEKDKRRQRYEEGH